MQKKPDKTGSPNITNLKAIIKKLEQLKYILSRLAFYHQQENDIDKDVDLGYRTKTEAHRRKIMIRLNKAHEQISKGWSNNSLAQLRTVICEDMVGLEDFVKENRLSGGDEFLRTFYSSVNSSIESQDIEKIITGLKVICRRAKKKPVPPPAKPAEGLPGPETPDGEARKELDGRKNIVLTPAEITNKDRVSLGALRKRLERRRKKDHTCFIEILDRQRNEPQFLYRYEKIADIVASLKTSNKTSKHRPTKKKSS